MIKYLLFPGLIRSRHDGERHFISKEKLIRLYKVRPEECIVFEKGISRKRISKLIPLSPRFYGDYENHLTTMLKRRSNVWGEKIFEGS